MVLDVAHEEQPSARAILADLRFKAWLWGVGCHTVVIRYSHECKSQQISKHVDRSLSYLIDDGGGGGDGDDDD